MTIYLWQKGCRGETPATRLASENTIVGLYLFNLTYRFLEERFVRSLKDENVSLYFLFIISFSNNSSAHKRR